MSECVVRMKKYGNCLDCDLHQIVYGDSDADTDVYCFKEKRYVGKRFGPLKDLTSPSWCPIICSLPEGHGRLVDEKEVKDWVENWLYVNKYYHPYSSSKSIHVSELYDVFQRIDAAVPAERSGE